MKLLRRNRRNDVDLESGLADLARIDALLATGLVERGRDDALEALTQEAAASLGTPMAFINVVDSHFQHHVAAHGWTGPRQEPADESYCQYVAAWDDVLVVNDSEADPLVRDNRATEAVGIRAYLGVPLRRDGRCLGSLCVVDNEPRDWTDGDLAALQVLADRVTTLT